MTIENDTKSLWSAAHYYRRLPTRDQRVAITVLQHLSQHSTDAIKQRANELLKRIDHDQGTDQI